MPHDTPLIATIVVGLSLAFVLGLAAQRLGTSPLVGYLLAGVAVGPFTPGFVGDQAPPRSWPSWASFFSCSAWGSTSP